MSHIERDQLIIVLCLSDIMYVKVVVAMNLKNLIKLLDEPERENAT